MKISPEIVLHRHFHFGSWLLPVKRPLWYYFARKQNDNQITNRSFIKSVDAPLKELVVFLHVKGIKTTPSCSGHYKSEQVYSDIFDSLEKDQQEIVGEGMQLKDVETEQVYCLNDKNYVLPWSKEEFIRQARSIQHHGIIGIRLGDNPRIKKQVQQIEISGVQIVNDGDLVFIHTQETDADSNDRTWKKITSEIKYIFKWTEYRS